MKTLYQLNPPVIAFILTVCIGWGVSLYLHEWQWLAISLALGLLAGDLVEALLSQAAPSKTKKRDSKRAK